MAADVRTMILVASLLCMTAVAVAQRLSGDALMPVWFNVVATVGAAAAVVVTCKPTAGLAVVGWLALGPIFMTYTGDNLSHPESSGVRIGTIASLVANACAIARGAVAQPAYRRST